VRPFDKDEINDAAVELKVDPALVEKEWHAVRVVGIMAAKREPFIDAHFAGRTAVATEGRTAPSARPITIAANRFMLLSQRSQSFLVVHDAPRRFLGSGGVTS